MQKITPVLWFNDNAEEAVKFYKSIFKKSKIVKVARYGEARHQEIERCLRGEMKRLSPRNLLAGRVTPCAPFAASPNPGAHGVTRPTITYAFNEIKTHDH
jgi:site-specific DNA-cytosine methylase